MNRKLFLPILLLLYESALFSEEPPIFDRQLSADVCVVGGGCAGFAAALAAGREGFSVILVEKRNQLGGTGTGALVSNWEAGPGDLIAQELFDRMKQKNGAGVARSRPCRIDGAYSCRLLDPNEPEEPYEMSLVRSQPPEGGYRNIPYKPEALDEAARAMLAETGKVTLLTGEEFFQLEKTPDESRIEAVYTRRTADGETANGETADEGTPDGTASGCVTKITARAFIDSTGSVLLCRLAGCPVRIGREGREEYGEPSAPEKADTQLNAVTRCYRIEPRENPKREEIAPDDVVFFPKAAFITGWKEGPRFINMTGMMPGEKAAELGEEEALRYSEKIVRNHWHWLQSSPDFAGYELTEIAPVIGIREDWRVVTKYVLREEDLRRTWKNQTHTDLIAAADHPCDIHGANAALIPVAAAYGIPYRCLIPDSPLTNLLVACRGAGFSHIAASSCRLQRTMIQLGRAAGIAAAWSVRDNCAMDQIDIPALVQKINARSCWPIAE